MSPRRIRHRVVRTRNKHSRAVLREDTIVIRLARNLSRTEEREHIRDLLRRMTRIVLEERQKIIIDPFRPLLTGQQSTLTVRLASGKKYVFALRPAERSAARRTRTGWIISVGPHLRRDGLHRALWRLLASAESRRMDELVRRINRQTYRAHLSRVHLDVATSQWGSCSPRGVIMVNAALLFVPRRLLAYIIVHELAHRLRADHSPAFWNHVARVLPRFERARRELQGYRLPTFGAS